MSGYEDYQRLVNYDSAPIVTESAVEVEKEKTLGRFFVARYAFLVGKVQFAKQPVEVILEWLSAETGGVLLGERIFRMDNLTPASASICVPHLGPWLRIRYRPESLVAKYLPVVSLMNSNRLLPFGFTPQVPVVVAQQAVKIAPKAGVEVRPAVYYAGPAELYVQSNGPAGVVQFTGMLRGWEYEPFWSTTVSAPIIIAKIVLPFTAWRFGIENAGAAEGEYYYAIVPSVSGST